MYDLDRDPRKRQRRIESRDLGIVPDLDLTEEHPCYDRSREVQRTWHYTRHIDDRHDAPDRCWKLDQALRLQFRDGKRDVDGGEIDRVTCEAAERVFEGRRLSDQLDVTDTFTVRPFVIESLGEGRPSAVNGFTPARSWEARAEEDSDDNRRVASVLRAQGS